MPEKTDGSLNKFTLTALSGILVMASLLYLNGLTASFSADDYVHLDRNIHFDNLWELRQVFFHSDGREYRPLVRVSLWLNHRMGTTALPFHITNLLLHLACTVSLYFLFFKLSRSRRGALIGCLLFALHPIHTTNVHFIMGRTGMLCALFYLLALLVFLEHAQRQSVRLYILCLGFFLLALLSKEEGASLPLLMLVAALLHPDRRFRKTLSQAALELAPFFIILAIYLALRFFSLSGHLEQIAVYTNFNLPNIVKNYIKWAVALAYPFDYYRARWAVETGRFAAMAIPLGIVGLMAAGLVYILRPFQQVLIRNRLVVLSLLWFVVTLLPISGGNAHRWYLYLPSAGLCLFAVAVGRLEFQGTRRRMFTALIGVAVACYGLQVYKQSDIWNRQSRISEDFFAQAASLGLDDLDAFYFINMPFGYKSAFLFTFNSFERAMALGFGKQPKVRILSYLNLDGDTRVAVSCDGQRLGFSMVPSAGGYFLFSQLQRTFPSPDAELNLDACRIMIRQLAQGGTVAAFDVAFSGQPGYPVYYFDGQSIHRFDPDPNP